MDDKKLSAPDWQKEIYLNGFAGKNPSVNIDLQNLALNAKAVMSPKAFAYIAGGAGNESTVFSNRAAFDKYKIVPRMLCNVEERDTSVKLFGQMLPSPFLFSPVGVLDLVHAEADIAVARAAADLRLPFIFSNQASRSMEECAAAMGASALSQK